MGKRQGRVDAPDNGQVHRRGEVFDQEFERIVDALGRDEMVVIESQGETLLRCIDVVHQHRQHGFEVRSCGGVQRALNVGADAVVQPLKRGDEIAEKAHKVVVAFIQAQPGDGSFRLPYPGAHERCLAESCGGGNQRELRALAQTCIDPGDQSRSPDPVGAHRGNEELALQ